MEVTSFSDYLGDVMSAHRRVHQDVLGHFIQILESSFHEERTIFTFGNGGSGAMASHFCEDLGKGTLLDLNGHKRFRVMSLTDNLTYIRAWANDHGYETIFEQQLRNFAKPGDMAVGISSSGNSENVIRAVEYANGIDMVTVGFTGFDGGRLGRRVQHQIHVPSFNIGIVESIHSSIMHYVVMALKERLDGRMKET